MILHIFDDKRRINMNSTMVAINAIATVCAKEGIALAGLRESRLERIMSMKDKLAR